MKQLIFFLFFLPIITSAQEFSFELYFEDALGNRDTLVLGYDPLATDSIDVAFGEENIIAQPWDSVFEVRIGDKRYSETNPNWNTENSFLSKKQIVSSYCESIYNTSFPLTLQFYTSNFPVKLSWDKSLFADTCLTFSLFYGKLHAYDLDVGGIHSFFKWQDSLIIKPLTLNGQDYYVFNSIEFPEYPLPVYIAGNNNIVSIGMVFYKESYLSLKDIELSEFVISPNPVNSNENVTFNAKGNYTIVDIQGKAIQKGTIENNLVQLINVESGIYFFILENENAVYKTKFVVR